MTLNFGTMIASLVGVVVCANYLDGLGVVPIPSNSGQGMLAPLVVDCVEFCGGALFISFINVAKDIQGSKILAFVSKISLVIKSRGECPDVQDSNAD